MGGGGGGIFAAFSFYGGPFLYEELFFGLAFPPTKSSAGPHFHNYLHINFQIYPIYKFIQKYVIMFVI